MRYYASLVHGWRVGIISFENMGTPGASHSDSNAKILTGISSKRMTMNSGESVVLRG